MDGVAGESESKLVDIDHNRNKNISFSISWTNVILEKRNSREQVPIIVNESIFEQYVNGHQNHCLFLVSNELSMFVFISKVVICDGVIDVSLPSAQVSTRRTMDK